MNNPFKKKFNVRLKLVTENNNLYYIEYAHYRFSKEWKRVSIWQYRSENEYRLLQGGSWCNFFTSLPEVENIARSFKTYEDIVQFEQRDFLEYEQKVKALREKIYPFQTKDIL